MIHVYQIRQGYNNPGERVRHHWPASGELVKTLRMVRMGSGIQARGQRDLAVEGETLTPLTSQMPLLESFPLSTRADDTVIYEARGITLPLRTGRTRYKRLINVEIYCFVLRDTVATSHSIASITFAVWSIAVTRRW